MTPAQYFLTGIVVLFIWRLVGNLRIRKIHKADFLIWLCFWLIVLAVIIEPNLSQLAADLLGIVRGADLVIYLSLMALFFIAYLLLQKVREQDQRITMLARSIAMRDKESKE
jgi:hypothetical protein